MLDQNDPVSVELDPDDIDLLCDGLSEWGGAAHCTDEMAVGMGFLDVDDLLAESHRLQTALQRRAALTPRDWARALVATEIVFASAVFGSGDDWPITTARSDEDTIRRLREVQMKLSPYIHRPAARLGTTRRARGGPTGQSQLDP